MSKLQLFSIQLGFRFLLIWINSDRDNNVVQRALAAVIGDDQADVVIRYLIASGNGNIH